MAQQRKRIQKVYLLQHVPTNETSVWSNLKKLFNALSEREHNLIGYVGLASRLRKEKQYKFIMDNEVWIILVKEVN
ncbi:MAG: hypothetical protein ACPGVB_11045 [Chitinophagales bacterium]